MIDIDNLTEADEGRIVVYNDGEGIGAVRQIGERHEKRSAIRITRPDGTRPAGGAQCR